MLELIFDCLRWLPCPGDVRKAMESWRGRRSELKREKIRRAMGEMEGVINRSDERDMKTQGERSRGSDLLGFICSIAVALVFTGNKCMHGCEYESTLTCSI